MVKQSINNSITIQKQDNQMQFQSKVKQFQKMRVVAVQYGFCHITVIIDTIFTYLTLSTYLLFGSTSARVAQHLTFGISIFTIFIKSSFIFFNFHSSYHASRSLALTITKGELKLIKVKCRFRFTSAAAYAY